MSTLQQRKQRTAEKAGSAVSQSSVYEPVDEAAGNGVGSIARVVLAVVAFFFLSSYVITDTWLWGYEGKWSNINHWIPVSNGRTFGARMLIACMYCLAQRTAVY